MSTSLKKPAVEIADYTIKIQAVNDGNGVQELQTKLKEMLNIHQLVDGYGNLQDLCDAAAEHVGNWIAHHNRTGAGIKNVEVIILDTGNTPLAIINNTKVTVKSPVLRIAGMAKK